MAARRGRRAALLVLALLLGLGSGRAQGPRYSPAEYVPAGAAGRAALQSGDAPAAASIAAAVAEQGFYAAEALGSTDCASCHAEIAAQWAGSAHRFSSFNNPYYAAAVDLFRTQRPLAATRFCAGCHDPLLLVDDAIAKPELRRDQLAAQAGLPCLVCHSVHEATAGGHRGVYGNGSYTLKLDPVPPPRSAGEPAGSPSLHSQRLRPPLLGRPDLCASCHRVGLGAEITSEHWLRGQDDYGPWLASLAAGNGVAAVYRPDVVKVQRCQDCHMPMEALASGRLVRSHRFLAANSALPHLRNDAEQLQRTADFLRGAVSVDLLVQPAVGELYRLDDALPVGRRDRLHFDVVLRNRRVGHRFPSGTNDSNQVWLEVAIAAPGRPGEPLLGDKTHLIRAQPVDAQGEPLRRRDPQNTRGVVYNTSLGPADPQVVRYVADLAELPAAQTAAALELTVTLRYRKFSPDYAAFACASLPATVAAATRARCGDPPTLVVASAQRRLLLDPRAAPLGAGAPPPSPAVPTWQRYLDHGLGLGDGLVDEASDARPSLLRAQALAPQRPEPLLGLARLALALGRTEDVLAAGSQAERLRPDHPAHLWLRGLALYRAYRFAQAQPLFERAARLLPSDPNLLAMLAKVRGLTGDAPGALLAADRLLALAPESEDGHHQRMLALRELGQPDEAERAEQRYLQLRSPTERDQELRQLFRRRYPERQQEDVAAHRHQLELVTPTQRAQSP